MKKVATICIALLALFFLIAFRSPVKAKVNWLSIEEVQLAAKKNPKPILIDVYTNWCGWCKVMDKETYGNEKVVAYINEHYYAMKFNAERKDSVQWGEHKFGYNPSKKINDLAVYLMGNELSFPTTIFITSINERPAPLAGFLKPKEMEAPLKYFGEAVYKTKTFPEFMNEFTGSW